MCDLTTGSYFLTAYDHQVGSVLLSHFRGQASLLVEAAGGSAMALVQLVAMHFPGFRDQAVYKGRQVGVEQIYRCGSLSSQCTLYIV